MNPVIVKRDILIINPIIDPPSATNTIYWSIKAIKHDNKIFPFLLIAFIKLIFFKKRC
jgi:hypothetical protein